MVVPNNRSVRLNIGYNNERKKGRKIFDRKIFHLEMVAFGNGFNFHVINGIVFVECILYSILI